MGHARKYPLDYSRSEILSDAAVHVLGVAAALLAVPVLITLAAVWRGDAPAIIGTSIYGATLIAMVLCSALYNMVTLEAWSPILRHLDHSAIYFKIAGTYMPFAVLSGGHGAYLVVGLWGAALTGAVLRIFGPARIQWIAFSLYLVMGWAGAVAGWDLFAVLSWQVIGLIVTGDLLYTFGTFFFLWGSMPFHNTIWHVFVLVASVFLFSAVFVHLADTSTARLL